MAQSPSNPLQSVTVPRPGQDDGSPDAMDAKTRQLHRLKELREELATLSRRSATTLTEIAKIQVRIQELADRLCALPSKDKPKLE